MSDKNPTTRRYPRTMQEAFGPYASHGIDVPYEPMHKHDKIVLVGCAVVGLFFIAWSLL